jgi:hypothetical protein
MHYREENSLKIMRPSLYCGETGPMAPEMQPFAVKDWYELMIHWLDFSQKRLHVR